MSCRPLGFRWQFTDGPRTVLCICFTLFPVPRLWPAQRPEAAAPRVDAPFTTQVESPHVPWGKPYPGPPIHAFVVPSVSEGRTLVELAERMNLTFDTVTIDDAWDVNTWTVGTDENYEARNYKLLYRYLAEDLTSSKAYDVIVLPSIHGWNRLPAEAKAAIRQRVQQGAGLVLIHPTTGLLAPDDPKVQGPLNDFIDSYDVPTGDELWEISPLVGALSDRLDARGFREIRSDAVAGGPWKAAVGHYITDNVPFEAFPADYVKHYKYRLGKDSTALARGADGEPIVAVKTYGRGRVVALGYLNAGLSPDIDWKILGQQDDHWWEYFYSMLCRSIIWAARREPPLTLGSMAAEAPDATPGREAGRLSVQVSNSSGLPSAEIAVTVVNEWGQTANRFTLPVTLRRGANTFSLPLPWDSYDGRHFVDVILSAAGSHYDWGSASYSISGSGKIVSVSPDRQWYAQGDTAQVSVATTAGEHDKLLVELLDNRGRLMGSSTAGAGGGETVSVDVGRYTTNIGWVRASLIDLSGRTLDRKQVRVNFASVDRHFGAYEVILPWYGPPTYQPWTPTLDEQFRKAGVTVVSTPERNFRLIQEVHAPGFGVYWHYREPYLQQKDKFLETRDKKYLVREPDLSSDTWLGQLPEVIRDHMKAEEQFRPLATYLADESSLTAYGDPLDFSWSPATLMKFREWLKSEYASLDALNREWGSQFQYWENVTPLTTSEAQAKGDYAGWMDHRTFMEQVFANALRVAASAVKQEDRGSRPSISGTQAPGASNAVNWYLLDSIVDYLQPYSEDDQDELHRSMRPGLILTGFTGYGSHGAELRYELWHRMLHGQTGASVFWQYTMLNADLTLTEQGRDLQAVTHELRDDGLALLLRGARRENCGIAVHYSLPSVRGQWITDGHIQAHEVSNGDRTSQHLKRFHENRHAWLQALEDAQYQYDFLTTEQIEAGQLPKYRVLILPDSIALSDAEVGEIRAFVRKGGLLIADAETGLMDGHARWQERGRIDDVLGVEHRDMRSAKTGLAPIQIKKGIEGNPTEIEVVPADPTLRPLNASQTSVSKGAGKLMIENRYGAGRAVTLNFWMTDYEKLRQADATAGRLALIQKYLVSRDARPLADILTPSGRRLECSEVVAYDTGGGEYLAILPEPKCRDAGAITLRLPAPRFVYNLRAHRFLGRTSHLSGNLVPGEPLVYALRDAPAARPAILPALGGKGIRKVAQGNTVKFAIRLKPPGGERTPSSAVHVEVRDPRGKIVDYYGTDLPLGNDTIEFSIPLALNDPSGTWHVTAREPFAHEASTAEFVVTPSPERRQP
ncbi:MAG TPA: beta-galactosidase trimerization domain-containing protein [Terriglobia bacterium]|nr:beta-galactosidase trimerization domain-containing protein [Terriglobia bacterium]